MKRPSRRTILIASIAAVTVVALTVGGIVAFSLKADADAHSAYDAALADVTSATGDLSSAKEALTMALSTSLSKAQSAAQMVDAADPSLLADPATVEALQASIADLVAAAELVDTDGVLSIPGTAGVLVRHRITPTTREALLERAEALTAEAQGLKPRTEELRAKAAVIAPAIAELDAAAVAVAVSAHDFGATAVPPSRASADSVAAFTAAVAALESPTRFTADLTELVVAYRDAWYATVASDAAARSTSGAEAATYIKGVLIVNKTYGLPSTFGSGLTADTSNAFAAMKADAAAQGLNLYISSGFRSFTAQTNVYNKYKANEGQSGADTHSARPGHSEHQSGLAFDLNTITQAFGSTAEGIWVAENAHLYGFIVRYPQGKEDVTGYIWEPWHLRYVGTDLAATLYSSGQTLEEYLGVTSVYS